MSNENERLKTLNFPISEEDVINAIPKPPNLFINKEDGIMDNENAILQTLNFNICEEENKRLERLLKSKPEFDLKEFLLRKRIIINKQK